MRRKTMRLTNKPIHVVLAYFYNNIILIFQSFFSCSFLSFFIFFNKNGKIQSMSVVLFFVFLFFFCRWTNFRTNFLFFILEEKKFIFFSLEIFGKYFEFFFKLSKILLKNGKKDVNFHIVISNV